MKATTIAARLAAVAVVASAAFACISEASASPASKKASVPTMPSTSGVLNIGGRPHPYLTEGTGLTCIMTGMAQSYPPLFSPELKQHIRFVYVDFKNSWNAESPAGVDSITMDYLVQEIDQVRAALGIDKVCVVGHSAP